MKELIEICLEDAESVIRAEKGGADRVELCGDLFEGGTTPTLGTFLTARRHTSIKINVMIRPRGGDFAYSDIEFETMLEDVRIFKENGADGIVFGILNGDGTIDPDDMVYIGRGTRPEMMFSLPCLLAVRRSVRFCPLTASASAGRASQ